MNDEIKAIDLVPLDEQIYRGEQPFITFVLHNEQIGALYVNEGVFRFEGNMDESAKAFFKCICQYLDVYIKRVKYDARVQIEEQYPEVFLKRIKREVNRQEDNLPSI